MEFRTNKRLGGRCLNNSLTDDWDQVYGSGKGLRGVFVRLRRVFFNHNGHKGFSQWYTMAFEAIKLF